MTPVRLPAFAPLPLYTARDSVLNSAPNSFSSLVISPLFVHSPLTSLPNLPVSLASNLVPFTSSFSPVFVSTPSSLRTRPSLLRRLRRAAYRAALPSVSASSRPSYLRSRGLRSPAFKSSVVRLPIRSGVTRHRPVLSNSVPSPLPFWSNGVGVDSSVSLRSAIRLLSLLAGAPVHLTRINALALSRFALDQELRLPTVLQLSPIRSTRNPFSTVSQGSTVLSSTFSVGVLNSSNAGFPAFANFISVENRPTPDIASLSSLTPHHFQAFPALGSASISLARSSAKTSFRFLAQVESERVTRFPFAASSAPDLLRLTFLARYLKQAPFLISIYAQSLTALPRNRKELPFLRFLRKLLKLFAAQRKERIGLRIRLQGRLNRWRRTKHLVGEKGHLPLFTYTGRIEYGQATATTRKGALGLRLWLAYQPTFAKRLRTTLRLFLARRVLFFV
jgi:hypothetical protein